MVTSKQIVTILDSYKTGRKISDEFVTVYENPTSSDVAEIIRTASRDKRRIADIRFVADAKSQKVYIADGYLITHNEICAMIGIPYFDTPWVRTGGLARLDGTNLRLFKASMSNFSSESFKYDWSFVGKYIQGWSEALDSGRWNPR